MREDPDEPIERVAKMFFDWVKREHVPVQGWVTALTSLALLAVTVGQLVVACNNARDTAPLVGYAHDQTAAAQSFAASVDKIRVDVGNASVQLGNQVGQMAQSTSQASRLASATELANSNVIAGIDHGLVTP